MSKNTYKIDGAKLKEDLEKAAGKSVYQISLDHGFSSNFIKQACKANRASPMLQAIVKLYGIDPELYIIRETELKQMTIEDMQNERLTKSLEQTAKAFITLGSAVSDCKNEIEVAFRKLSEEWNKALEAYNESIKRLKEGK